jgi:hypothetical protein
LVKSGDSFSKRELEAPLEGLAAAGDFKLYVDEAIAFKAEKGGKAIRPRALFSQQRRFTEDTVRSYPLSMLFLTKYYSRALRAE